MGGTFIEQIISHNLGEDIRSGQIVEVEPHLVMSHDNAGLVIKQFQKLGVDRVYDPARITIILDHRVPAESVKTAEAHKLIREFVDGQNVSKFHEGGDGICHQVVVEERYARPGMIILGTDSHTTSYGAVNAFSTGIGATEMATVWATGKIWLRVPETIKINLKGKLPGGVYAKDLILHIIGEVSSEGANYRSVEFHGDALIDLSISERFTLSNMSMEMGAKSATFPPDTVLMDYYSGEINFNGIWASADANYETEMDVILDEISPEVACPHEVDNVRSVEEVSGTEIDQVLIGTCTNGRLDDLMVVDEILSGWSVHPGVRLLVAPASRRVLKSAMNYGIIDTIINAGGVVLPPGCGPCLGAHQGLLAPGERVMATSNRNFRGRMGSPEAEVYLGSPATATVSAIMGRIVDPREFL